MEILQACATTLLSTIVKELAKSTGHQVGYIFRFKSIIEDVSEEAENLRWKQEDMQQRVDRAIKNTEEIEEEVQKWLRDAGAVVADVQNLENESRERKKTCLNCTWKYRLARRAEKKKIHILNLLRDSGNFHTISHRAPLLGLNAFATKNFIPFESNLRTFNEIIGALKDDKINMVGLYGMGGVGKTTLAKKVVNKTMEEKFFNRVVMVFVSQTPNIRNIQGQIADFLTLVLHEESIEGRAERLSMRLKNEKKILIILDDVWAKIDLTRIGIPVDDHHKDCKIFLTTRQQRVCVEMECQSRIQLNVLSEEEGLFLFKRQVGLNDDSPTLINLVKEVAKECKGLPLAIVTIGSVLREKTTDEWKVVIRKLKMSKLMDVADTVNVEVYACLKVSYDYLKTEKTKFCFLLCSLFPEDHEIDIEVLVSYGLGLGLYQDINLVADARSELRATINSLKASSLLLDAREGYVKMHDMVRDVALSITSKGEDVFMVKAGMGLTMWPEHEGLEQCKAISLMENEFDLLPNGLVCPKLNILLLGSRFHSTKVSEEFFAKMNALRVLSLELGDLSLNSLQSLTNLVTLQLTYCKLRDISSLKKLVKLEILHLCGSKFVELPEELRELSELKILDVRRCYMLERIPANVLSKLSGLEELYIGDDSFKAWGVEGTSAERSNATLSELSKLYRLTALFLNINVDQRFPKEFIIPTKLLKYEIKVNKFWLEPKYLASRSLRIRDIEATSLFVFKAIYENVEYLELVEIRGCYQNIVPSIDETGLNELKNICLKLIKEVECIIDMTQQHVPSAAFSNLETLEIERCSSVSCLFPSMLIQRLRRLKEVTVNRCGKLQEVFQLEGLCSTKENPFVLSSLASLYLDYLSNLRHIWRGPTQQVRLQSLTSVEVRWCHKLKYLFTLTLARSLLQLKELKVWHCISMEHIVAIKAEETEENVAAGGGNDVVLPKLTILRLDHQESLINFCSENYSLTCPALQELVLISSTNWTPSPFFVSQLEAGMQTANENLQVLQVESSNKLCNTVLTQLKNGFQNLESLIIKHCSEVQVIFQLEGVEQVLSLPSLKYLVLENLEEVECLYKGPPHLLSLPSLKTLEVSGCNRMRHLFSSSVARNLLLQLEQIDIRDCWELEQIIVEDDTEDNEADMTVDRDIELPQLGKLNLESLASLVNFCPSGYHLIFPSLSRLIVSECPKITTRFSVDQNGSVHAEAEDVVKKQSLGRITSNIFCWNSNELRRNLPPYIGNWKMIRINS